MGADMRNGIFEAMPFGQLALEKLGAVPDNFRLYVAGIKPEPPKEMTHMEITGAQFRESKSGPNMGKLNILMPGTRRTVRVTRSEIENFMQKTAPATA